MKPLTDQDPLYISSFIIFAWLSHICWVVRVIDRTFDTIPDTSSFIISVQFIVFFSAKFEIISLICIDFWYFGSFVSLRVKTVLVWSDPPVLNAEYDYPSTNHVRNMDWWTVFDDLLDFLIIIHSTMLKWYLLHFCRLFPSSSIPIDFE